MTALLKHEILSILSSFRRRPLVPLVASGMLALGIAANVAVFTVISRTLLRPLPYAQADRLLVIESSFIEADKKETQFPSGSVEIVGWQRRASLFSSIEAIRPISMTVRDGADPESVSGATATGGIFRALRVRPVAGRDFTREDDIPDARVGIITYGYWQRKFGGRASAIGRSLLVDGRPISIIGVLPRGFESIAVIPQPDLFIPAGLSPSNLWLPASRAYRVYGRLRDGVTQSQGESELRRISGQLATEFKETNEHWTAKASTLRQAAYGERSHALVVLWIAVGLVHLLACVNVAMLLSAQIADERGITALRLVLGAGRRHIVRYRLIESLLITGIGTIAGLIAGSITVKIVLKYVNDPTLDAPVLGAWRLPLFLAVITLLTGVLVAIIPALRETRTTLTSALNEQGSRASSSVRGTRVRELFIVAEVALAVPLLLAASDTVQRFRALQRVNIGFDPRNVLVSQLIVPPRYEKAGRARYAAEAVRRIQETPGVESAAVTQCNFSPNGPVTTFASTDRFPEPISLNLRRITPGYFSLMRIPLIKGRAFNDGDSLDSPPVAIIDTALARRMFPNQDPIGQKIRRSGPPMTIVGVAPLVLDDGPSAKERMTIYIPYLQNNNIYVTLVVRAKGDPLSVRDGVRRALWTLDRDLTPSRERPLEELTVTAVAADRLQMILLTAFGFIALILASVGIYGMTSYAVAKRMREIGIRLAFGATPRDVIVELVARAARSVAIGLAAGIVLTLAAQRAASLVVYGAAKFDGQSAAVVMALLFAAALVAGCVPSLRSRNVQPAVLLREV
jgi:predicted permease